MSENYGGIPWALISHENRGYQARGAERWWVEGDKRMWHSRWLTANLVHFRKDGHIPRYNFQVSDVQLAQSLSKMFHLPLYINFNFSGWEVHSCLFYWSWNLSNTCSQWKKRLRLQNHTQGSNLRNLWVSWESKTCKKNELDSHTCHTAWFRWVYVQTVCHSPRACVALTAKYFGFRVEYILSKDLALAWSVLKTFIFRPKSHRLMISETYWAQIDVALTGNWRTRLYEP